MTIFKWNIVGLERVATLNNIDNVVTTVHWRYSGSNEDNIASELYGSCSLPIPSEENFIPYENITKEDVESWIVNIIDVTDMQTQIDANIYEIANPKTIIGLPWINTEL